jgi:hypothetical protein
MYIPLHGFTKTQLKDLLSAKDSCSSRYLRTPRATGFRAFAAAATAAPQQNVVGVGIAEKISEGQPTGVLAVKFLVIRKYSENELAASERLPKTVGGLPVDVEQAGVFRAFGGVTLPNPKQKLRPAQPGCSIGFEYPEPNPSGNVMAGTFGAVVRDSKGTYILSNNHVLAHENQLAPGAAIFQPGLLDGGVAATDAIAKLTRFIPLQSGVNNQVDAAIAAADSKKDLSRAILHIGAPAGTTPAAIDQRVHKFGRTTSYTAGRVTGIAFDVTVAYETGSFTFGNQITITGDSGPFSAGGDSGSLIVERQTNKAVGLLFAGSPAFTLANHIEDVLSALGVTLA